MFWKFIRLFKPIAVPMMEGYFRLRDRILLLFLALSGQSTVRKRLGVENIRSGHVVIFAAYPAERLSSGHVRLLEKFAARGYSIIIATNHAKGEQILSGVLKRDWCFLFRRALGRDFGCYRDAMLMLYGLHERGQIELKRIVLLNDSVITISEQGDGVLEHLSDERHKYAGMTENYNFYHHIGSFMVAFDAEVALHPKVMRYWQRYRPLSTRRYSIQRGEFGLAKAIRNAGYIPYVRYSLAEIKRCLEKMDFSRLNSVANAMEPHFRYLIDSAFFVADDRLKRFLNPFKLFEPKPLPKNARTRRQIRKAMKEANKLASQAGSQRPFPESGADYDEKILSMVRYRETFLALDQSQQAHEALRQAKEDVIDAIVSYIFRGSQIHHGASVLLYIGAGFMKKDVVFRRIVEPFNIKKLLFESGASSDMAEIDEIAAEVLAKGHPYSLRGRALLMYDWDFL